jgi:four helix bundle protein
MDEKELKDRTKAFALRVLKVVEALPKTVPGKAVANQLIRSGTSVAANYRAACICRSKVEFTAKLGVVLEEADESCFWLEFIAEGGLLPAERVTDLRAEGEELRAIFIASIRSAKGNVSQGKPPSQKRLVPQVKSEQAGNMNNPKSQIQNLQSPPVCPDCGKPMARRKAKSGKNAGREFWGCTGYPECKGVREVEGSGK